MLHNKTHDMHPTSGESIITEARILTRLESDNCKFHLELPRNGHQILGHLPRKRNHLASQLVPGDTVRIEMTPFDLNKGKILQKIPDIIAKMQFDG